MRAELRARHASHKFWKFEINGRVQSTVSLEDWMGVPPGPRPIRSFRLVRRCRVRVRVGSVRVGGVRVSWVRGGRVRGGLGLGFVGLG